MVTMLNSRNRLVSFLDKSKADFDIDLPDASSSHSTNHSTNEIVFQRDAPNDLWVVSWPTDTARASEFYAYDDEESLHEKSTTIYLIDRGLDAKSEVSL